MTNLETYLLSQNGVEGNRKITANLRPLRVVILIDPASAEGALAAIASCTLTWGGQSHLLIPCSPEGTPHDIWLKMLDIYDPDEIVDMVGASEEFIEMHTQRFERVVLRRDNRSDGLYVTGVTVYSALRQLTQERGTEVLGVCPNPIAPKGHRCDLALAFRWGRLSGDPANPHDILRHAIEAARHDDFVTLSCIDIADLTDDELTRILVEPTTDIGSGPERHGWVDDFRYTLLELTLSLAEPKVSFSHDRPYDRDEPDPTSAGLVVIGSLSSVSDLCLAWNLRALRLGDSPFPIWIEASQLANPTVHGYIAQARASIRGKWLHPEAKPWIGLVSATMSPGELKRVSSSIPGSFVMPSSRLDELYPTSLRLGVDRESVAPFHNGASEIALPDLAELGRFHQYESLGLSVDIDGWVTPRVPGPLFTSSSDVTRVSRDGVAGIVRLSTRERFHLARVRLDPSWQVAAKVAQQAGYGVQLSDKGRQAIAVMRLLRDTQDLYWLASSSVYALMRDMARIIPRQAVQSTLNRILDRESSPEELNAVVRSLQAGGIEGGQFNRPFFTFDHIKSVLGCDGGTAKWILDRLVKRRLLTRGYELACPECGLRRWYVVDRLSADHLCDGCQLTMPLPLAVDKPLVWRYRLNETVALAVDQGVLPHLLAIRRMLNWTRRTDGPLLGFVPGVVLTPILEGGRRPIEVDILAIRNGQIVLAECKANGQELGQSVEVERMAEVAKAMGCSRIIYATPTSFDAVADNIEHARSTSAPILVEFWEAMDMLDPRDHEGRPQQDPMAYLTNVVSWINSYGRSE